MFTKTGIPHIYGEGVADRPGVRSGVIGRGYKYRLQRIYIYTKKAAQTNRFILTLLAKLR